MAYLDSDTITRLRARAARYEAEIDAIDDLLDEILAQTAKSYRMDTSEGSFREDRHSPEELRKSRDFLERQLDSVNRRLGNLGNVNLNVRRGT